MLVLTRKTGESIIVANNIRVKVIEVTPGGVKIGIEAPRDVSIVRAELHEEVAVENRRSQSHERIPEGLVGHLRKRPGRPEPGPPSPGDPAEGEEGDTEKERR